MPLVTPRAPFKLAYSPDYYLTTPTTKQAEAPAATPAVDIHNITAHPNLTIQPPKPPPPPPSRTNCIFPPAKNPPVGPGPSWIDDVPQLE